MSERQFARLAVLMWSLGACVLVSPGKAWAIPQFARRYNLKCFACHTIPPVLNEQGYMFRRLGYHLPPALEQAQPAHKISDLVRNEPQWSLTNNVAPAVTDFSFTAERTTQEGQSPSSTSSFQVAAWNMYMAGWLPDTNFFYYAEFDIVTGGASSTTLMNANFGYSGGSAKSSWYVSGGREHLHIGEGTRAAQIYSLLPASPLMFENMGPTNFIYDHSPVGIDVGYTWASSKYKNVLAATLKVTNGLNADGSEILGPSDRNSKDVWFVGDWWYAPESGVTFCDYYGRKDQIQNPGQPNQFSFTPTVRRQGVFANYMIKYKVDVLGGYLHSNDDWQSVAGGPFGHFTGNDSYGAVDYYILQGLAVSGRYDLLHHKVTNGVGLQSIHDWGIGVSKTLTPSGNVIARAAYSYLSGRDPVSATKSTDRVFQADIAFNF